MNEELIELLNKIDGTKCFTYFYACILVVTALFVIYTVITIPLAMYVKKAKENFIDKQEQETKNKIREYNHINILNANKYKKKKERTINGCQY